MTWSPAHAKRLSPISQFLTGLSEDFWDVICYSSLVLSWALVESVRRLRVWWQILTLPWNDMASWMVDFFPPTTLRYCKRILSEFFLLFCSCKTDQDSVGRCTVVCFISLQNFLLRSASSPSQSRTHPFLFFFFFVAQVAKKRANF